MKAEIEVYRDAGIEIDRVERRADRGAVGGKGIAVIADGAFEDERDGVRAVVQVVEDLRVGGLGVRVVDPLHHAQGGPARGRDRTRLARRGRERLDGDAVIGLGRERGGRAFERFFHKRAMPPRRQLRSPLPRKVQPCSSSSKRSSPPPSMKAKSRKPGSLPFARGRAS